MSSASAGSQRAVDPGQAGMSTRPYLKVRSRWTYLYRAVDRDENLIDAMLSAHRDMRAAKVFFRSARAIMGFRPDRVTTNGPGSYLKAIRSVLGRAVRHRTSAYLNNRLEQDHRGTKSSCAGRSRPWSGLRPKHTMGRDSLVVLEPDLIDPSRKCFPDAVLI